MDVVRYGSLALWLCSCSTSMTEVRAAEFIRGNANGDATVDVSDAVSILLHLFAGQEAGCLDAMDANDDGVVDVTDVVGLLSTLFLEGGPLPAPFGECGEDPTPDDLDCAETSASCPALLEVRVESGTRVAASGDRLDYDLLVPVPRRDAPPPYPAVVLTHGFARTKERLLHNAEYLAERGMVVLTPDLSSLLGGESDQIRNIENTADHVRWLVSRSRSPGDSIEGLVDPARIGLAGHSAGGAVTFEAALALQSTDVSVAAVGLLDAVPWDRTLETASDLRELPLSSVRAEPSSCNANGTIRSLLERLSFPVDDVTVVDAGHCDPENPTDILCQLLCGGSSDVRRATFQRLLYLFFQDAFGLVSRDAVAETYAASLEDLEARGAVRRTPLR